MASMPMTPNPSATLNLSRPSYLSNFQSNLDTIKNNKSSLHLMRFNKAGKLVGRKGIDWLAHKIFGGFVSQDTWVKKCTLKSLNLLEKQATKVDKTIGNIFHNCMANDPFKKTVRDGGIDKIQTGLSKILKEVNLKEVFIKGKSELTVEQFKDGISQLKDMKDFDGAIKDLEAIQKGAIDKGVENIESKLESLFEEIRGNREEFITKQQSNFLAKLPTEKEFPMEQAVKLYCQGKKIFNEKGSSYPLNLADQNIALESKIKDYILPQKLPSDVKGQEAIFSKYVEFGGRIDNNGISLLKELQPKMVEVSSQMIKEASVKGKCDSKFLGRMGKLIRKVPMELQSKEMVQLSKDLKVLGRYDEVTNKVQEYQGGILGFGSTLQVKKYSGKGQVEQAKLKENLAELKGFCETLTKVKENFSKGSVCALVCENYLKSIEELQKSYEGESSKMFEDLGERFSNASSAIKPGDKPVNLSAYVKLITTYSDCKMALTGTQRKEPIKGQSKEKLLENLENQFNISIATLGKQVELNFAEVKTPEEFLACLKQLDEISNVPMQLVGEQAQINQALGKELHFQEAILRMVQGVSDKKKFDLAFCNKMIGLIDKVPNNREMKKMQELRQQLGLLKVIGEVNKEIMGDVTQKKGGWFFGFGASNQLKEYQGGGVVELKKLESHLDQLNIFYNNMNRIGPQKITIGACKGALDGYFSPIKKGHSHYRRQVRNLFKDLKGKFGSLNEEIQKNSNKGKINFSSYEKIAIAYSEYNLALNQTGRKKLKDTTVSSLREDLGKQLDGVFVSLKKQVDLQFSQVKTEKDLEKVLKDLDGVSKAMKKIGCEERMNEVLGQKPVEIKKHFEKVKELKNTHQEMMKEFYPEKGSWSGMLLGGGLLAYPEDEELEDRAYEVNENYLDIKAVYKSLCGEVRALEELGFTGLKGEISSLVKPMGTLQSEYGNQHYKAMQAEYWIANLSKEADKVFEEGDFAPEDISVDRDVPQEDFDRLQKHMASFIIFLDKNEDGLEKVKGFDYRETMGKAKEILVRAENGGLNPEMIVIYKSLLTTMIMNSQKQELQQKSELQK